MSRQENWAKDKNSMGRELSKLYYTPTSNAPLGGVERLYRAANGKFTHEDIKEWF